MVLDHPHRQAQKHWTTWRRAAERHLPKFVFDYLEGGCENEACLERNIAAFQRWLIVPKVLRDCSAANTSASVLQCRIDMPVVIAPIGLCGLIHPKGDVHLAAAAAECNVAFVLSTASSTTYDAVRAAFGGSPWFQLYVLDEEHATHLIRSMEVAGSETLILTVDAAIGGFRSRELSNRLRLPLRPTGRQLWQMATHPSWSKRFLCSEALSLPYAIGPQGEDRSSELLARRFDRRFDWSSLARVRDRWKHRLVVKGVLDVEDAKKVASIGADGIVVSNHGGRQLDSAPAPLDVLPEIATAVGRELEVFVDSGIRTGEDVFKAIALGAKAVMVGRLPAYGLAVEGRIGTTQVLKTLQEGLLRAMILAGCNTIDDVRASKLKAVAQYQHGGLRHEPV